MTQGIILFAHGSRDPLWRAPMEAVAARVRERSGSPLVACAYLELTTPDLATAAAQLTAQGAQSLHILPMFLGVGRHAREDLPQLVAALRLAHPAISITLRPSIGEDSRLLDLLADLALDVPLDNKAI